MTYGLYDLVTGIASPTHSVDAALHGVVADGTTPCTDAIMAAIRQLDPGHGGRVYLPTGDILLDKQLVIDRPVHLIGNTTQFATTRLIVSAAATTAGVVIEGDTVSSAILVVGSTIPGYGRADGAILEGLAVYSSGLRSGPLSDGIRVATAGVKLVRCLVYGFPRHGIYIRGNSAGSPVTFASLCVVDECQSLANGECGLLLQGYDGNVIKVYGGDYTTNLDCNVKDESFLGCTYVGVHTSAGGRYNYFMDRSASPTYSGLFGCYSEQDAPSKFTGNIVVWGGDVAGITADSAFVGTNLGMVQPMGIKGRYRAHEGAYRNRRYEVDEIVEPDVVNGYHYRCTVAGTTGGSQPAWPTTLSATVADGTVTWACEGTEDTGDVVDLSLGVNDTSKTVLGWGRTTRATGVAWDPWKLTLSPGGSQEGRFALTYGASPSEAMGYADALCLPHPGAVTHRDLWVGEWGLRERRVCIAYGGSPEGASAGVVGYFQPGDLILNGELDAAGARQGSNWGWVVTKLGARARTRMGQPTTWTAAQAYNVGDAVSPSSGGAYNYVCVAKAATTTVSGGSEPSWGTSVGYATADNGLSWMCVHSTGWTESVSAPGGGAHATSHQAGGVDPIKLDDLAAPDDNTDLNVSASAHGLCPKRPAAPGDTGLFLRGDGTWAAPPGGSGGMSMDDALANQVLL